MIFGLFVIIGFIIFVSKVTTLTLNSAEEEFPDFNAIDGGDFLIFDGPHMILKNSRTNTQRKPNGLPFPREALSYILNPTSTCEPWEDIILLVCVTTRVNNFEQRHLIRDTWGNKELFSEKGVKVVFIVGTTEDDNVQFQLSEEFMKYNDIVQVNSLDKYHNLTVKSISTLNWASKYCANTKFVLKSDDDMFVNMFSLLEYIQKRIKKQDRTSVIYCRVWTSVPVQRSGKYAVSSKDANFTHYPDFCGGPFYLMSMDVVSKLHPISLTQPMFKLEDVHITGFLRTKIGINLRKGNEEILLYNTGNNKVENHFLSPHWKKYIATQIRDASKFRFIWNKMSAFAKHPTPKHKAFI